MNEITKELLAACKMAACHFVGHDSPAGKRLRAAIAMAELGHVPRPEAGTQRYNYTLNGIGLECDIEFEREDGDGWNEPREPATATLCKAYLGDTDIFDLLSAEQCEEIETAFLEQEPEYDVCDEPDFEELV